jgi:hypothetical protein
MKGTIGSLVMGASLVASGLAHRRAGEVGRQVSQLADALASGAPAPAPATSAPAAARAGMALPTGYGLQVRGPAGEALVIPVCLPPGFELESMMLCPEFLARDAQPAPAAAPAPVARPEVPVERIAGTMQYVYGAGPAYQAQVEHHEAPAPVEAAQPERVPVPFARAGVETHHLA